MYGQGIYRTGEVIDLGVQEGLIDKSGAWYSYQGQRIGQGKANAGNFLDEHPEIATEIETTLRTRLMASPVIAANESVDEAPAD
jgi:recombination protein RecA